MSSMAQAHANYQRAAAIGNKYLSDRAREFGAVVFVVSIFGPYVIPSAGLRTEQFIAYPLFFVLAAGSRMRPKYWAISTTLPVILVSGIPVGFLGSLYMLSTSTYEIAWPPFLANLEAILLGAVVAWLGGSLAVQANDPWNLLRRIFITVVAMIAINGVVAISSSLGDATSWLGIFWSSGGVGSESVATRALSGNRFSGVFNQPYEAGLAHSVALILLTYLFLRGNLRARWLVLLGLPIVVGGLLPVSKVFMLGGLPIGGGYLIGCSWMKHGRIRVATVVVSISLAGAIVFEKLPQAVSPVDRFFHLFQGDILYRLGGGRYGVGGRGGLDDVFSRLVESPIVGFGLDPQIGPLDNAFLAQMILGGILAMVPLAAAIWIFARGLVVSLRTQSVEVAYLQLSLFLLLIGSMFGAHPFLVNRASSLFLFVLAAVWAVVLRHASACPPVPAATSPAFRLGGL